MKKLLCLVIIAFASCQSPKPHQRSVLDDTGIIDGAEMIKIRGCEYIRSHVYLGRVYTHCGDCNNPIHKIKL